MLMATCVLATLLPFAQGGDAGSVRGGDSAVVEGRDGPLSVDPSELPTAEPGRWSALMSGGEGELEKLDPEVPARLKRASAAYKSGDYPGAVGTLVGLLRSVPDLPQALQLLGTTYYRLRRYGDAAVMFERFLLHAPDQVWRTQALGHCLYSLGRYEEARAHYERVLQSDLPEGYPDDSLIEARRGLGLAHVRLGAPAKGLAELHSVVEARPDHSDAWTWIGQVQYDEGELELAREALEKAKDLAPFEPRPWFLLSQVYSELELEDQALVARERWREVDVLTQRIRSVRGKLLYNPKQYDLSFELATLHGTVGDFEQMRAALGKMLRARPRELPELDAHIQGLTLMLEFKDFDGLRSAASDVKRKFADDPLAWKTLEGIYFKLGETRAAVEAGERYRRLSRQ